MKGSQEAAEVGLRSSIPENRSCMPQVSPGISGHFPGGEAKDLWGRLVRYEVGKSLGARNEQDCSFWQDKIIPLN